MSNTQRIALALLSITIGMGIAVAQWVAHALAARMVLPLLCVCVALAAGACSPVAPSASYSCHTQPRVYSDGIQSWHEVDVYASTVPCPFVPIK